MAPDLLGSWNLYRHGFSRHPLKSSVMPLHIREPKAREMEDANEFTCLAQFDLSGFDTPVTVIMDRDPRTDAWFGECGNFAFRWDLVVLDGTTGENPRDQLVMLVGSALDRGTVNSQDLFVAVRESRLIQLPQDGLHQLKDHYQISLERKGRAHERSGHGGIEVQMNGGRLKGVKISGSTYRAKVLGEHTPPEFGQIFTGEWSDETDPGHAESLWLWIFAIQAGETERLLATGYLHETFDQTKWYGPLGNAALDSVPANPYCSLSLVYGGGKNLGNDPL